MFLLRLLRYVLYLLLPFCVLSTSYIYFYPIFNLCAFPTPEATGAAPSSQPLSRNAFLNTVLSHTPLSAAVAHRLPPFRLLAVGDPQLEGTTSLDIDAESFPHYDKLIRVYNSHDLALSWRIKEAAKELRLLVTADLWSTIKNYRKRLDLWGNDLYLAHLIRTTTWWTRPTHVSVLGDLLGSQWIDDDEFASRAWRFWHRVFPGYTKLTPDVTTRYDKYGGAMGAKVHKLGETGLEAAAWTKRLLTLAGNHDIGYGGDITPARVSRFEAAFGSVNYELEFTLPLTTTPHNHTDDSAPAPAPKLRIVVLNNMNLDSPVLSPSLQADTYAFLNTIISTSPPVDQAGVFTLLLTHIPLHKAAGICVDAPLFEYHTDSTRDDILEGGIRAQNHLAPHSSAGLLTGIFGMSADADAPNAGRGRKGLIMVGHDHEGCDVWHFVNQTLDHSDKEEEAWEAARWTEAQARGLPGTPNLPGLREITVRSAMGDFGGNIGLLSLSFNTQTWEWEGGFGDCGVGRAWIWWVVHVCDLVAAGVAGVWWVVSCVVRGRGRGVEGRDREGERRGERERKDWVGGKGTLDGKRRSGRGLKVEKEGERPRSRGKESGNSSGSDSGAGKNTPDRPKRRSSGGRKVPVRGDMGRRQLSAVLEMPE